MSLTPEQQALIALRRLRARVEELEGKRSEAIAVIGLGCRFPGGVSTPEAYWQLLRGGIDAITEVPPDRWDVNAYYDADPDAPGKMHTRYGGFVRDLDRFDPQFFGIAPREAIKMDPQQRLLVEVAWEALEHAGQAPDRLAGTRTGVFLGLSSNDYVAVAARRAAGRSRRLQPHGECRELRGRADLVPARPAGPESDGRHGVLLVARRGPPGLSELASGRMLDWPSRAAPTRSSCPITTCCCRRPACSRRTADARRSMPRRTATCAAKAADSSSSSA